MKKVKASFGKYSDSKFLTRCQAVSAAMTDNDNFPTPVPALVTITEGIADYSDSLSAAENGGKTEIAIKNKRKQELAENMQLLGDYVNNTAAGDEVSLTSSGFDLVKSKEPLPPVEAPEITRVDSGVNSGEMEVGIKKPKAARLYMYQYTPDPMTDESLWTGQTSTRTKFLFTGLESGRKYWFRVIAYGNKEQAAYSDPVPRIVQ